MIFSLPVEAMLLKRVYFLVFYLVTYHFVVWAFHPGFQTVNELNKWLHSEVKTKPKLLRETVGNI